MFIASNFYWKYLVREFKKGVSVVNNSKMTFCLSLLQVFKLFYSLQVLKTANT